EVKSRGSTVGWEPVVGMETQRPTGSSQRQRFGRRPPFRILAVDVENSSSLERFLLQKSAN
ncbi:hypothetical protein ATANTOWER_019165, partial [Ataeniobius toweri]|nr:hypothetical protein [Ataeniobius toweri]